MAKVTMLEIEQCNGSHKLKNEIDDVFDEIFEDRLKTENEMQIQYVENDDVFDEVFERQLDLAYQNAELENRLNLTVKCLLKEEKDDVFDEEREKTEEALVKHDVDFVNGDSEIKIEVGEDNNNVYEEKKLLGNFDLSAVVKVENEIQDFKTSLVQNIDIDNESLIEVDEQKIKVEVHDEDARMNVYNCEKCTFKATQQTIFEEHSLLHEGENLNKDNRSTGTEKEAERNSINENNDLGNISQSNVNGGNTETGLETVIEIFKHVGEQQSETTQIELREQNTEVVNANTVVDNTGDKEIIAKKGEMCKFISIGASNRKQSDKDNEQENSTNSCSKNAKEKGMDNLIEESETIVNTTGKENVDPIPKDISQETICNSEVSNTEKDVQELLNEKEPSISVPNKALNGEEKKREKQSHVITSIDEKQKRLHKAMKHTETVTVGKENVEQAVTETTNNETKKTETPSNSPNRNKQNHTDTLIPSNLSATEEVVNNDNNLENIEYCCTKCSYRTKHRTMFKTHLTEHGTEFFSGVISFLDLVNEKIVASQYESGQVHDEIDEQCTVETQNTILDEVQTENKEKLENEGEVDTCKSLQSNCQVADGIQIADNEQSEMLNIENNTICEQNETIVLDKENESFRTAAANIEVVSENQIVQSGEAQIINENVSSGEKLLGTQAENRETDDKNESSVILNEENNTAAIETNIEKDKTPLQFNENEETGPKAATYVDGKSENVENLVVQNQSNLISETSEAKPNKRKSVQKTRSASKKIKLENDEVYRCDECSYRSHKKRYFDNHKIIHSKDVIKCNYCSFTTNLQRYMTSHMLVHLQPEEIKMYKCPHCSYQTKRRGDLPIHMVLHKKPEEIQMFQCDKCSYKTKRKTNLRSHELSHKSANDITIYSCALCSFTAKKKYTLKSHMIVHQKMEEIHWYKCGQCSYSTKYKAGLRRHGLVHKNLDEIKTYDCQICLYKAKHKSHLKSHLLIHKDPKEVEMHRCDHCPYKSIKKSNLRAHMLQHKKIEEINMKMCAHCPYQTKLKCNLIKHINRIHSRAVV